MKLRDWLKANNTNDTQFAKMIGTTAVTVGRLRRGANNPTWPTMARIYARTGGQVAPSDFADFIAQAPADHRESAAPRPGMWGRAKQIIGVA